jgi:hypothetical protein
MRAGMMPGLTLCWRLSSAAARAFQVTKSAGACFAAVDPLPLRFLGMANLSRPRLPPHPPSQTFIAPRPGRPACIARARRSKCKGVFVGARRVRRIRNGPHDGAASKTLASCRKTPRPAAANDEPGLGTTRFWRTSHARQSPYHESIPHRHRRKALGARQRQRGRHHPAGSGQRRKRGSQRDQAAAASGRGLAGAARSALPSLILCRCACC